ncbi:type VII secretion system-associated protein [Microbacterium sp.]|uniref:type VII secretion system-associated protein n=1 Tax=Microbacterium sp. TaxID=51671 RepID=UPI00263033EC|nr:type VII secretion system-associated protein [Microbacterium sp.]
MSDRDLEGNEPHMTTPSAPPITEALRDQARANPGGWVYAIDPEFEGTANVPPEGIIGAWRSDVTGEINGRFTPNPKYVPSPPARGWPTPTTKLERVLQLARAGHATGEQLEQEFASSEVLIFSRPEGGLFIVNGKNDTRLGYAFTDATKAAASGVSDMTTITGRAYAEALPEGVLIALNPGSEVPVIIDPADILKV